MTGTPVLKPRSEARGLYYYESFQAVMHRGSRLVGCERWTTATSRPTIV